MCSEDKPAQNTDSVYAQLVGKHPAPPSDRGSVPDPQPTVAVEMTEEELIRAVRSIPPGSAGDPDEVRPQHTLEMVSCRESGTELRSALTGFVNCLLQGHIHPQVSPVLFGGSLIALEKKFGGIRPIAVGYTLRRIVAKCANSYATNQIAGYFSPIRLGVGTPRGSEASGARHGHQTLYRSDAGWLRGRKTRFLQHLQQYAQRSDASLSAFNSPSHLPILPSLLQ